MTAVLADLAVESWAATADRDPAGRRSSTRPSAATSSATALLRIALPVAKFWVCKRAVPMIAEALECLGGNGYVETYPMARLLRESPLNGIWEGSGTVTALDALRALQPVARSPRRRCWPNSATATGASPTTTMRSRAGRPARRAAGTGHGPPDRLAGRADVGRLVADPTGTRPVAELYCATRLAGRGPSLGTCTARTRLRGPATGSSASCRPGDHRPGRSVPSCRRRAGRRGTPIAALIGASLA